MSFIKNVIYVKMSSTATTLADLANMTINKNVSFC
jgi:hypothetical protein